MNKNYSFFSKILHKQFLNEGEILNYSIKKLFDEPNKAKYHEQEHIFITGLARAGTTSLLQAIDSTSLFGSFRYKYMPFVLYPKLGNLLSKSNKNSLIYKERLHGDGLKINTNSSECLDEPFWINTIYKKKSFKEELKPHSISIKIIEAYGSLLNSYMKLENKKRLIIKNNNHHLRILSLSSLMRNSKFLVVFRSPVAHALSLLNMHIKFLKIHSEDNFSLDYMNMIGHWEFGANKKPFIYEKDQKNLISTFLDTEIRYWIKQWIFTYKWLLENIDTNERKNIRFICYESLCSSQSYRDKLLNYLNIKQNSLLFKFRLGMSNSIDLDDYSDDKKYADKIYDKLKNKSELL